MALTSIISFAGAEAILEIDRGNIGTLVTMQGGNFNNFSIPLIEQTGGSGGEYSVVF